MNGARDLQRGVVVVLVIVAFSAPAPAENDDVSRVTTFAGYARDRTTDALLYTERHSEVTRSDGTVERAVTYVAPDGKTIATYRATSSSNPMVPEVLFEDQRWHTAEGVRYEDGAIVLFRKRSALDGHVDEKRPKCVDRPVADAGLDTLVHGNWDRLLEGERVVAELLIPQRLRCLQFSLAKTDEWRLDGEPVVTIEMAFSNPLIRLLAGSLVFTYHRDHRFVVRFEGKSRLVDASGDHYVVRVDFPIEERSDRTTTGQAAPTGGGDG